MATTVVPSLHIAYKEWAYEPRTFEHCRADLRAIQRWANDVRCRSGGFEHGNPGLHFPYLDEVVSDLDGGRLEQDYLALERFAGTTCAGLHIPYKEWLRVNPEDPSGPRKEQANLLAVERWAAGIGRCCTGTCCWSLTDLSTQFSFTGTDPGFVPYWQLHDGFACDESATSLYATSGFGGLVRRWSLDGAGNITSFDPTWCNTEGSFERPATVTGAYDGVAYFYERLSGKFWAIDTTTTAITLVATLPPFTWLWADRAPDGNMYGAGTQVDGSFAPAANVVFKLTPAGTYTELHTNPYGTGTAEREAHTPCQLAGGAIVFVEGTYGLADTGVAGYVSKVNADGTGYATAALPTSPPMLAPFDQPPTPRADGKFWLGRHRFNADLSFDCACPTEMAFPADGAFPGASGSRLTTVSFGAGRTKGFGWSVNEVNAFGNHTVGELRGIWRLTGWDG